MALWSFASADASTVHVEMLHDLMEKEKTTIGCRLAIDLGEVTLVSQEVVEALAVAESNSNTVLPMYANGSLVQRSVMIKIGIIIGSTRPDRKAEVVAKWAYEIARKRKDAEFELVDIAVFNLPLLDEPMPPVFGQYSHDHTRAWSAKIA